MKWRAHGLTSLFWAALAAWGVLAFARFEAPGFEDRIVSDATIHAVDVGARAKVYFAAFLVFVLSALVVVRLSARLVRAIGEDARANLERASGIGLMLVFFAGLTSIQRDAVWLCASGEVAYVLCALARARVRGSEEGDRHGSAFLIVACAAYALLAVTPLRTNAPTSAALTIVMLFVLATMERAGKRRSVEVALAVSAAAAFVPLALVLREELVLIANQRGIPGVSRAAASLACAAVILAIGIWIARRRPFDAVWALARVSLPALLLGFGFLASWTATRDPQFEMLEAGNAGLSIQQWFDHGRLPFFDTFNVHGLSDCLMGFLYSLVNGWSQTAWQHWDFVPTALLALAIYAFLARVFASPTLAFVLVAASPFTRAIFPPEVAMAVAFALVAAWSAQGNKWGKFLVTACLWIGLCAWRMDIGGAAAVALISTWIARHVAERERRFAWKQAALAFVVVIALVSILVVLIASVRQVDLFARFAEFRRIASSDTAFGRAEFIGPMTHAVSFRLFIAPALCLVAAVWLLLRARRSPEDAPGRRFATYALLFLAAFSLVIFTRGLVRHTFVEHDATYVTAFQFAVIALAPVLATGTERRGLAVAAAVLAHVLLPLAFDVSGEGYRGMAWRANSLTRASIRLRGWSKTDVGEARFDRTPIKEEFANHSIEPMRELKASVLAQGETFVDLSASPMLYVFSGARSPHWTNHLIVLQGDFLQKRFLAELEKEQAPLIVMQQEPDMAVAAGMIADVAIDKVPIALWHARLFDELMSRAEPFTMAGRWQVWARSDWAPARDFGPPGERLLDVPIGDASTTIELDPGATLSLAVLGSAAGEARFVVHFSLRDEGHEEKIERTVDWSPGTTFHLVDLLTPTRPTTVSITRVGVSGALVLERVRARRTLDPLRAEVVRRAETPIVTELGRTASLWGKHDRSPRITRVPLTTPGEPARAVQKGVPERLTFAPPPRAERSLLFEATLSNPTLIPGAVVVRYGVGDQTNGAYRFELSSEPGPAQYVFRPGMQANWHRRPNAWIEIESPATDLLLHTVRLCAND